MHLNPWAPRKTVLRDFINATVGFTKLGQAMHRSPKSRMRMLGPTGNPHAKNLFAMVAFLQRHERVRFKGPVQLGSGLTV